MREAKDRKTKQRWQRYSLQEEEEEEDSVRPSVSSFRAKFFALIPTTDLNSSFILPGRVRPSLVLKQHRSYPTFNPSVRERERD